MIPIIRRFAPLLILFLLGLPAAARADLRVVATVPDLAAIAREIGGAHVQVSSLALPTQDPHFVDARPSLALDLARADVLLVIGLDLEAGWLPTLQTGSRNGRIQRGAPGFLDCSRFVRVLETQSGRVDRSHGDVHPGGSPHYLFDPRQGLAVARGIAAKLADLDAPNAAHYRAGLQRFEQRLRAAMQRWQPRLAPLRGQNVIAYHRSFAYLADWAGLRIVEHIEPRPGIPPSPAHVARVLQVARTQRARLILQERFYPDTTARLIAQRTGARLVLLPGGTDFPRGASYVDHLARVVVTLSGGS